jgi:hypothetical protein
MDLACPACGGLIRVPVWFSRRPGAVAEDAGTVELEVVVGLFRHVCPPGPGGGVPLPLAA